MRSAEIAALAALLWACGGAGPPPTPTPTPTPVGLNVLPVTVNGSLCNASTTANYPDKPCVSVTVCAPGSTTDCQTVNDVLLDTGSYGLRLFKSALGSVALQPVASGVGTLATCVQFADQTSDWGPVELAEVVLAGEPAVQVPIHVLDATFSTPPSTCPGPEPSPAKAGFNGVLGVGVFREDCGSGCVGDANAGNNVYFSCTASACVGASATLASQVRNPVAALPLDNNGLIIELPAVGAGGAPTLDGVVVLGIGTRANNVPGAVTALPVDGKGEFSTQLGNETLAGSFMDTGSNGLFFAPPAGVSLPACAAPNEAWYCRASTVGLSATLTPGGASSPSFTVPFQIANFDSLFSGSNRVFDDAGGSALPGAGFDWGLPFDLGRQVVVGIDGATSSVGTGPFVAF